jgi:hypothetical protein
MESQTALDGTCFGVVGYRCMVPAMSGLLRSTRACGAALLALALVVGINGLEGAIHSTHHLPAPVAVHAHDLTGSGHDEQGEAPAPETAEPCPVAAAASHVAAAAVEPPPTLAPVPAALELVALGAPDAPRVAWRKPGSGRAPPFTCSLLS